ncbi:MAG: RDD family protein [Pseudomonadota bacterium]
MRKSWLGRRLGALLYDSLLIIALWLLTGALVLAARGGEMPPVNASWYSALLLAVPCGFYLWFWLHGGQTLGMRAWNLRLTDLDGNPPRATACALRLAAAIPSLALAGLGLLWTLVPPAHRSWHGLASATKVVYFDRRSESSAHA